MVPKVSHLSVSTHLESVSHNDSSLAHVTCFGQWDKSKSDRSRGLTCVGTCSLLLNFGTLRPQVKEPGLAYTGG